MGPSGSGKSTLMHVLAGLDQPTEGTVDIDGTEIGKLDDRELTRLRRDKIGFVFQAFNLVPVLTAEENIRLPLTLAGRDDAGGRVAQLLEAVALTDRRTHRPAELSGGQQQRVAVARALASEPAVIFADEPTGNLDSRPRPRSSACCAGRSTSSARPSSWSRTRPPPRRSPTA